MALGTYVTANGLAGTDSPLVEQFREINRRLTDRYEELYEAGLAVCGWRIRDGFSLHDASVTLSALAEGVLMRMMVEPEVNHTDRPGPAVRTGRRSSGASWPSA